MKAMVIGLLLLFGGTALQAQDRMLYWKYKDYDGAIPITAPRWVIGTASLFLKEKQDRKMIRKVHKLRVLVFEGESPIRDADRRRFDRRAKRRGLEDLVLVREGGTHVRVMARDRGAVLRKIVVFVQSPEEFVLVSLRGKLRINEIGAMLQQLQKESGKDMNGIIPQVVKAPAERV